jgi:hypothetical protein
VRVELAPQFGDLLPDSFQFRIGFCIAREMSQIFDVFF